MHVQVRIHQMSEEMDMYVRSVYPQAFIHDTKVAGEKEVKVFLSSKQAQIRLGFKTVAGRPVVLVRTLSLKQGASKQELKTLEAALVSKDDNGQVQIA